jgi:heavy metal sensor kinase
LLIVFLLFVFLDYRLEHELIKEVDHMLFDEAQEVLAEAAGPEKGVSPDVQHAELAEYEAETIGRENYPIYFRVLNKQEGIIYVSSTTRGFSFPPWSVREGGGTYKTSQNIDIKGRSAPFRLLTYSSSEGVESDYVIQVATYLRRAYKTVKNFRDNLYIAFGLAVVISVWGGWALARRTFRPIDTVTEAARGISFSNFNARLPRPGTDDELDRLVVTFNDMFERLQDSFEKLRRFTADAAHELRTPIAAFRGETEVILSQDRSSREYREILANNLDRLEFLTKLDNELLFLSQADKEQDMLNREPLMLDRLLMDVAEAFQAVARQKGLDLSWDLPEDVSVTGDDTRLRQVFTNLIDNATRYTPEWGNIRIAAILRNGNVRVTIKDTGIGIPEDEIPHIFDRFYRVDKSRSREDGGTGLGLNICEWIVKAHQGSIEVQSRPGKGTTIHVTLPSASHDHKH